MIHSQHHEESKPKVSMGDGPGILIPRLRTTAGFSNHLRRGRVLIAVTLLAPLARGQDVTPPEWSGMTGTQRYLSSLYMPADTTPWSDATTDANISAWGERGSFQACGMLQRNQGADRANALKLLQRMDATMTDGTGETFGEFGGTGLIAARAYFGNLFDAATATAVDHALLYIAGGQYNPGRDTGRNPDWTNYALMNALLLNYCGSIFNNSTWSSAGATRMANIEAAILRHNCDPEHNSTTYEGVAMTVLSLAAKAGRDADFRARAKNMKDVLWGDIALHYNASMRNLSGPYYRAYGYNMDFSRACAETGMAILAYTQDLETSAGADYYGGTTTRFCILNGITGLGTPADVPDAVEPALLNFQGKRRFIDTYQNTFTIYTHDVAIEEDRMAAVINNYAAAPGYPTAYWNPFGFPPYQLVMTLLQWKSGIPGGAAPIATLKIYDSSYYRTRFNADGDIELLMDRDKDGAIFPLRFVATSSSATPAAISPTRWDMPGQSFDVVSSLPAPTVTVSGDETTILYDTSAAATNTVALTLKYVKTPTHNWLGGQFKSATLLEASSAGAANSAGVYITQMTSGSAGYTAGLRVKDIVTAANGQVVKYTEDLFRAIRAANGGSLSLTVRRSGANVTVPLGTAVPQAVAINATSTPAYAWRNSRGGTWSTALNWRNGAVPVTTGSDTLSFADADLIFDSTLILDANPIVGGLVFGDVQATDDWLVSGSGSFHLAPSAGTPAIEVLNQTTTIAVPLSGSAGLVKTGAGRLVLSSPASTYTGATKVAAGLLQFANPDTLYGGTPSSWTSANLVVQTGATAVFNVGGADEFTSSDLDVLAGLGTAAGGFQNGSFLGFDTTNAPGGVFSYSSPIAAPNGGTNSMGIAKLGEGTLILTAANTYTGGTAVAAGTLVSDTDGALGTGDLRVANGATCELRNTSGALTDTSSVYLATSGGLRLGSGVNETVSRLYINGVWQVAGTWNAARDPAHFSGSGSLTVLYGDPNTPTGLTVSPGYASVSLGWAAVTGATSYTVKRATVSGGPYTTLVTQAGTSFTDSTAVNGTTYYYVVTATVGGLESTPTSPAIATPGTSIWTGATSTAWETAGNWSSVLPTSSSVAQFAGPVTTNKPSVTGANSVGGLLFESPGWAVNSATSGTLTVGASGIVVNASSGTVTLNKAVTVLNGGTRVWKGKSGSVLVLASLGTPAATTPLQWGVTGDATYQGTLKLTYSGNGPNVPFYVRGGTVQAHKSGWINDRDLTVDVGGTFLVTYSNGDLMRGESYGAVTLNGGLINWGGFNEGLLALNLNGGTLRGGNSTLTVSSAVGMNANMALGDSADTSKLKLARSGTTATCNLGAGTRTLTVNSPVEIALPVDNGALDKDGTGTLILSATNTYSGGTSISAGTLEVNGSLAAGSNVTVATSGKLTGAGTINSPVVVNGNLAPGVNGSGNLRIANTLSFSANSNATFSLNRASVPNCTGTSSITTVTYAGTLNVTNIGGTLAAGDRFVLFGAGSYTGTFAALNLPILAAGLAWDTSTLSTDGSITVKDVVPPVITVPADITSEATGAGGAVVTFSTFATDAVSGSCATVNTPASGSTFPLGTTTVMVTSSDAAGNSSSKTFTVTVQDMTGPVITVPADITAEATGAGGAVVAFSTSATDAVSGSCATVNSPASGSTFPLGTTTVTVTSSDAAGNSSSKTFTVTVQHTPGNKYWDTSADTSLQGGGGTWDAPGTALWSTTADGSGSQIPFWNNDTAFFQTATPNAVTVSGSVSTGGIIQSVNGTATTLTGGTLTLTGGISNGVGSGDGALTIHSALVLGIANTTVNAQQPVAITGVVANGVANAGITKNGTGILTLSGNNTFSGNITFNAGTLKLTHSKAAGVGPKGLYMQGAGRTLQLSNNTILGSDITLHTSSNSGDGAGISNLDGNNEIRGQVNYTFGNPALNISSMGGTLLISGNITLNTTSRPLILGGTSANANTVSGAIGQSAPGNVLSLTKQGTGKWILTGANTYTGATSITGGTLVVNGSITNSASVTVGSTAILGGNGSITPAATINGTIQPGDGLGTLGFGGNLALAATAKVDWELGDNSESGADRITAGQVTATAGATVNLIFNRSGGTVDFSNAFWSANRTWTVLTSASAMTGALAMGTISADSLGAAASACGKFSLQSTATGASLVWTAYSPMEKWRLTHFGSVDNSGNAADPADPDADGLANLVEYAIGTHPLVAAQPGGRLSCSLVTVDAAQRMSIAFARHKTAAGVSCTVETSPDLSVWTANAIQYGAPVDNGDGTETVTFHDPSPVSQDHPRRFIRLHVTSP